MPQFRQSFITKEWVIIAPERAKRPDQFGKKSANNIEKPPHDPKCPFCTGNEAMTPLESFAIKKDGKWSLRVVPNKFAAVNSELSPSRQQEGLFLSTQGFGIAEVVIEHTRHDTTLALMSNSEIVDVLRSYKNRYATLEKDGNIDMITVFRNHGLKAGTSIEHPHSQIIATPIVPPQVRHLMQQMVIYHDTYGRCSYCDLMAEELRQKQRILMETERYVALCPYASHVPFETIIVPKRHYSHFSGIEENELVEMAEVLRIILKKLYCGLNDPDYNYVLRTSPTSDGELHYDHWRLSITPRTTTAAGFEIGSGIFINVMPPETAAEFLRGVKAD